MNKKILSFCGVGLLGLTFCTTVVADLRVFYVAEHCGYKDAQGEVIIPLKKYEYCGDFSDGLAYVGRQLNPPYNPHNSEQPNRIQGFIDSKGRLVIPVKHTLYSALGIGLQSFSEGLVVVSRDDRYGYMNKQQKLVIPYRYVSAGDFKEGLAVVLGENWKRGVIDKKGNMVIPFKFDQIRDYSEGLAVVSEDVKYGDLENGEHGVLEDEKSGVIDKKGNMIVPFKFDYISDYSEGLAVYSEKNHWNNDYSYGYLDKKGEVSIKGAWSGASRFSEGLAAVNVGDHTNGKWGLIDKTGSFVVEPEYDELSIVDEAEKYYYNFDDGYFKDGKIDMYKYTDASNIRQSSITRYTIDRQGSIISKKLYSGWDAIINEFLDEKNKNDDIF